ncbi:MAG: P1 family peptidase [Dehalococcoidia bacterium]
MPRRAAAPPPRDALTDVRGIRVGHWTDRRAVTGCTVVLCPPGTVGGVDVRGAAPGTRETDLLRPENTVEEVHAVLLSGGSAFGLDAAGGVMRYLLEQGVGFRVGAATVPIVPAAILFDLNTGRMTWPDAEAGYRAAARASGGRVQEGSVGAGTGATVAKQGGPGRALKSGLGTASEVLDNGLVVAALVAVNAVGTVRDPATGEAVAAPRGDAPGAFLDMEAQFRAGRMPGRSGADADASNADAANTTIAVVATNGVLTKAQTNRLATVAHDGFARAIWPVHTRADGDAVFALATGERPVAADEYPAIEAMAPRAVERAIVHAVRRATGLAGVPSAEEWLATGPARGAGRSGRRSR